MRRLASMKRSLCESPSDLPTDTSPRLQAIVCSCHTLICHTAHVCTKMTQAPSRPAKQSSKAAHSICRSPWIKPGVALCVYAWGSLSQKRALPPHPRLGPLAPTLARPLGALARLRSTFCQKVLRRRSARKGNPSRQAVPNWHSPGAKGLLLAAPRCPKPGKLCHEGTCLSPRLRPVTAIHEHIGSSRRSSEA